MPWQACLSPRLVLVLEFVRDLLQHLLIRLDALGLDRAPRWRVVARRGQEQRAPVAERDHRLNRAFAERARAQNSGALMILKRTSHNLGCRGADRARSRCW